MVCSDPRSHLGQAISSVYKGPREEKKSAGLLSPLRTCIQFGASGDMSTYLGLSLTRWMLGKAHAVKLLERLLWRINSGSCFHHDRKKVQTSLGLRCMLERLKEAESTRTVPSNSVSILKKMEQSQKHIHGFSVCANEYE